MGRSTGVPGAPEIGSRRLFRAVGVLGVAAVLGGSTTCGWLDGDAEPIVLLGSDGGGTPEAGTSSACPAAGPFALYYWTTQADAVANSIDFLFKVANNSGGTVPLSALDVRYYFTNEITPTWQTSIYYAGECCGDTRSGFTGDVAIRVNALATPTATADHYLDVTFDADAGALLNGDSVQIEVGFYAPEHDQNLNQANDYSFVASATGTQAEWNLCPPTCAQFQSCVMTVYDDGALVWGLAP